MTSVPKASSFRSNSTRWPKPDQLHKWHGVRFYIHHIHAGNDPDGSERKAHANGFTEGNPSYVTTCSITDDSGSHELGYGEAVCNPNDSPDRRMGHEIAVTRAIKNYMEKHGHRHPVNPWNGNLVSDIGQLPNEYK